MNEKELRRCDINTNGFMNVPFSEQHFYDSVIKLAKWCVYKYKHIKLNENEVATWVSLILGFDLIQLIYDYIDY